MVYKTCTLYLRQITSRIWPLWKPILKILTFNYFKSVTSILPASLIAYYIWRSPFCLSSHSWHFLYISALESHRLLARTLTLTFYMYFSTGKSYQLLTGPLTMIFFFLNIFVSTGESYWLLAHTLTLTYSIYFSTGESYQLLTGPLTMTFYIYFSTGVSSTTGPYSHHDIFYIFQYWSLINYWPVFSPWHFLYISVLESLTDCWPVRSTRRWAQRDQKGSFQSHSRTY